MKSGFYRIIPGILMCLIMLLSGCNSTVPGLDTAVAPPAGQTTQFMAGDGLRIVLPLDSLSFLNGVYKIDEQGTIALPIIGKYKVVGVAPFEFTDFLKKSYEQYLHYPEVEVIPLIRVSVLGGFNRSGLYYVEPDRSVWDLISMAGGTIHERGLKKMRWERNRKILSEDLIPVIQSGKSLQMIGFQSGDQIWTPSENKSFRETLVRDVLPFATFFLSIYLGVMTIKN